MKKNLRTVKAVLNQWLEEYKKNAPRTTGLIKCHWATGLRENDLANKMGAFDNANDCILLCGCLMREQPKARHENR